MNTHFTLDRESLQNLLARASLAQEYLDSQKATCPAVDRLPKPAIGEQPKDTIPVEYIQSLSAIAAVQRSIATDSVEVDVAMAIIADQARNVANANGVAIGLLEGDNLVYRAGSGGAATYIGRHVKATLSVSRASGEILRVENTPRFADSSALRLSSSFRFVVVGLWLERLRSFFTMHTPSRIARCAPIN